MPRRSLSLGQIISDIARRRKRAGQTRFGRAASVAEAPKHVFATGCAAIARTFAVDGYRFAASGPHLSRRFNDFEFRIAFQSSRDNIAGEYVALWIHVLVRSRVLKEW